MIGAGKKGSFVVKYLEMGVVLIWKMNRHLESVILKKETMNPGVFV